jgi:hypothetical protein
MGDFIYLMTGDPILIIFNTVRANNFMKIISIYPLHKGHCGVTFFQLPQTARHGPKFFFPNFLLESVSDGETNG